MPKREADATVVGGSSTTFHGVCGRRDLSQASGLSNEWGMEMALLWALVLLLIIFAIVGGAAVNSWLFLILVIALVLVLAGAFS